MQKLTAKRHILYESRMYLPGDILPTNNQSMLEAWIEAGTAVWMDTEQEKSPAKAIPKTAEPGLAGDSAASEAENGENLVGKVPASSARKRK